MKYADAADLFSNYLDNEWKKKLKDFKKADKKAAEKTNYGIILPNTPYNRTPEEKSGYYSKKPRGAANYDISGGGKVFIGSKR